MTLKLLTHDTLHPLQHGFFTRAGGASSGVFAGLNCGSGSTDQTEIVAINRARVAARLDVPADHLLSVYQVHSTKVIPVSAPMSNKPKADAMVTATPGLALSVLSADCQPVLFADHKAKVIGAAHAGWRGTLDGVLEATMDAMEALGATAQDIHVVIGPSISQRAYEVGPEFFETHMAEDDASARYFANGKGDRMMYDLPGYGLHRLRQRGVASAEWTRHCTYSDPEQFFSYRRSVHDRAADYGRLIAAIRL